MNDCKDCREAGGLVKYIKEKTGIPLIVTVRSCQDLHLQLTNSNFAIAYIGQHDTPQWTAYETVSKRDDVNKYAFLDTTDANCAKDYPGLKVPGFVFGRAFD